MQLVERCLVCVCEMSRRRAEVRKYLPSMHCHGDELYYAKSFVSNDSGSLTHVLWRLQLFIGIDLASEKVAFDAARPGVGEEEFISLICGEFSIE